MTIAEAKHTFDIVHLDNVLLYGIVKLGLFPCQTDLSRGNLLEGHLWGGRNVEAQLLDQHIIGGLTDLPCSVQKPVIL